MDYVILDGNSHLLINNFPMYKFEISNLFSFVLLNKFHSGDFQLETVMY
jgi:hypothetical protein